MSPSSPSQLLFRQGGSFIAVGLAQLLLDWLVFVGLTALGVPAAPGNLAGRTQTLPLAVYETRLTDPGGAIFLSLILVVISVAVLVAMRHRITQAA